MLAACVISVTTGLLRYRILLIFNVVKFEILPLLVWNWLALSATEITTEEAATAEVTASYDSAEHEQRFTPATVEPEVQFDILRMKTRRKLAA